MTRPAVLYMTYDGLLEPLGESQVVAYVRRLARRQSMTVLSFEKPEDLRDRPRVARTRRRLIADGVNWIPLRYHKRPTLPATAWDIARGVQVAHALHARRPIAIAHARGYVASMIALGLARRRTIRFLFDMRGFWPEEKVEAGHWTRTSLAYRLAKRAEQRFFRRADAIVSLTHAGAQRIREMTEHGGLERPIAVIPTCADLERFSPRAPDPSLVAELRLEGRLIIGCVGTLSNWYLRTETLRYLALITKRHVNSAVLFITREDHDALRRDAIAAGITRERVRIVRADFTDMPNYLRLLRAGVFFIAPSPAKLGSAATKLGELLGCGVPVVINDGVGDSGSQVRRWDAGVVLRDASDAAMRASLPAVDALLADAEAPARCRRAAEALFDVEQGAAAYQRLYDQLTGGADPETMVDDTRPARDDDARAESIGQSVGSADA